MDQEQSQSEPEDGGKKFFVPDTQSDGENGEKEKKFVGSQIIVVESSPEKEKPSSSASHTSNPSIEECSPEPVQGNYIFF